MFQHSGLSQTKKLIKKLIDIEAGYNEALELATSHYENFPVVSFLVPKELRKDVAAVYWFARTADDIADEGDVPAGLRLLKLDKFEERFLRALDGEFKYSIDAALNRTINERQLTPDLFLRLLKAFKQDVIKKRYKNFGDVLNYCTNSANPVGRLILELNNLRDPKTFEYSDKICTALQLTNFYQDISLDYQKGRIYLAEDEMEKFGVTENSFELKENNLNLKKLLHFNIERTYEFFNEGKPLLNYLTGRLKLEIKWTILGGIEILNKIKKGDYNSLILRPKLRSSDFIVLLLKSLKKI